MFKLVVTLFVLSTPYILAKSVNQAICVLGPKEVTGTLYITKTANGSIAITGEIYGLKPGKHGFHVHQSGDIITGCGAAGAHFNPENKLHGGPCCKDRHAGDLGNAIANDSGVAIVNLVDQKLDFDGIYNMLGRSIVVHADEDDFGLTDHPDSKTTGNSGARIACCTIVAP